MNLGKTFHLLEVLSLDAGFQRDLIVRVSFVIAVEQPREQHERTLELNFPAVCQIGQNDFHMNLQIIIEIQRMSNKKSFLHPLPKRKQPQQTPDLDLNRYYKDLEFYESCYNRTSKNPRNRHVQQRNSTKLVLSKNKESSVQANRTCIYDQSPEQIKSQACKIEEERKEASWIDYDPVVLEVLDSLDDDDDTKTETFKGTAHKLKQKAGSGLDRNCETQAVLQQLQKRNAIFEEVRKFCGGRDADLKDQLERIIARKQAYERIIGKLKKKILEV